MGKVGNVRTARLNMRGERGSAEVRHVTPVIDLNWRRMTERRDESKRYYSNMKTDLMLAVMVRDAYPNLGSIFGDRIVVR
jgi:hypothetical protein